MKSSLNSGNFFLLSPSVPFFSILYYACFHQTIFHFEKCIHTLHTRRRFFFHRRMHECLCKAPLGSLPPPPPSSSTYIFSPPALCKPYTMMDKWRVVIYFVLAFLLRKKVRKSKRPMYIRYIGGMNTLQLNFLYLFHV